ncbi:hypothetical protein ElyMa_000881700 [Elysia marginata]|uniref:Uncharacterized protein n=1 Tax=Elysia marginata TaxID=1093978 RepID=A0AAV4H8S9_9GAST|nr:hypothetical protein ElyMa_000881700 [Elysia marginata]
MPSVSTADTESPADVSTSVGEPRSQEVRASTKKPEKSPSIRQSGENDRRIQSEIFGKFGNLQKIFEKMENDDSNIYIYSSQERQNSSLEKPKSGWRMR